MRKSITCNLCKKKLSFEEPKNYKFTDLMPDGILQDGYFYCQDCCDKLEDEGDL